MVKPARAFVFIALIIAASVGHGAGQEAAANDRALLVFAGASLKNALDAAAEAFNRHSGTAVTASYAATSALAKQIEAGAPADVFMSADLDWMDYLAQRDLIRAETRRNLLANRLVLIAPKSAPVSLRIGPGFSLASALGDGRLAMANTAAVPAGKYARKALEALGVWTAVEDRVAQADNVRMALALVSRGEAPLGIVYATDAAADPNVDIVDTFAADSHPPIVYPVAVVAKATNTSAAAFVDFLAGDGAARRAFAAEGFEMLPAGAGY